MFAHSVRGPLKVLKETFLSARQEPQNILDFVSTFRERLHNACSLACETLGVFQERMKRSFDKRAVPRQFQPGAKVMVLLPVSGPSLSAKFSGLSNSKLMRVLWAQVRFCFRRMTLVWIILCVTFLEHLISIKSITPPLKRKL